MNKFIIGCNEDGLEAASTILGYLSILCWLNAQLPQIYKNYMSSSSQGLSIQFLLLWLLGDVTNLLGAVMTHQLAFQQILAVYFCLVDLALWTQHQYYGHKDRKERGMIGRVDMVAKRVGATSPLLDEQRYLEYMDDRSVRHTDRVTAWLGNAFIAGLVVLAGYGLWASGGSMGDDWSAEVRKVIGRVLAWICAVLYLSSRLPQVFKNHASQSVEGLSIAMFTFAALGNLTYALSILINPHSTRQRLIEAIPFLVGSLGTLAFDVTIFVQWWYFRKRDGLRLIWNVEVEDV